MLSVILASQLLSPRSMRDHDWKSLTLVLFLTLASLFLASCSQEASRPQTSSSVSAAVDTIDRGALEGEWTSGCITITEKESEILNYSIKKEGDRLAFRRFKDSYVGTNCEESKLKTMEQNNGFIQILSEEDGNDGYHYRTEVITNYTYRLTSLSNGETQTEENTVEKSQLILMARIGKQIRIHTKEAQYLFSRVPRKPREN